MLSKIIKLRENAGFVRYFHNTSWMMGEQVLRIVAGLFVGIWVARYLGPEKFGIFSYVLAYTAIFSGIAKLGLDAIVIRELVNNPEKRDIYLGTAFWLKLFGSFILMGIIAATVPFTSNDTSTNQFIFIVATGVVFQCFEVVEFYFQSQVLAKVITICKIIQLALSATIKVYLVLTKSDLLWFILVTVFDSFTLAISYCIAYRSNNKPAFYKYFDRHVASKLLNDSWPLLVSSFVVMIYMRIDQIMIKEMLGGRVVGIYSAAVRISEAFYFIPTVITSSIFPAILNSKKISQDQYVDRIQRLYTFMIWVAIAVAIPVSFMSGQIIEILFGVEYAESAIVLSIHVWAAIFVFLTVSSGKHLTCEGQSRKILYRNFSGMILNVLLNIILIPKYHEVGAAVSTVASWAFAGYLYDFFDKNLWAMARQKTRGFVWFLK